MTSIQITPELLKPYFLGSKMHRGYSDSVRMYHDIKVHADGEKPFKLIDERRPNESDRIKEYRMKIYEPITKDIYHRVFTSLTKIRRSVDWSVKHPNDSYPSSIPENERLRGYADIRLPLYENLENWLFTIALKNYLLDANGIVLVVPQRTDITSEEYLQPIPIIYNSPSILEYRPNELLIVKQTKETELSDGSEDAESGQAWLVVTTETLQRWETSSGGYTMTYEYQHALGILPAFKLGGQYFKSLAKTILYESRISPMLPRLNDAAREYSDMQAEVVLHIHSEKWEWTSNKCGTCRNSAGIPTGFINDERTKKKVTCPSCKGNLYTPSSPYLNMTIRPTNENLGETNAPIPPAGYITKPIDIVELQDRRIDAHLFKALASINMQFLDQSPLNQSGKAKEVDKDELNNFVYSVAEDLVRILDLTYWMISEYRYHLLIPDYDKRRNILPVIKVPEKYDLLSSNYLTDEIKAVKDANINPVISSALEIEFVHKKFYHDPTKRDLVVATIELDPLAGRSEDDKMVILSNGGASPLSYIISANITSLVMSALASDPEFFQRSREDKQRKIEELGLILQKSARDGSILIPKADV